MQDVDKIEGWLLYNRTCRDSRAHEVAEEWVQVVGSWKEAMKWFELGLWNPRLVRHLLGLGYGLSHVMSVDIPDGIRRMACKSEEHWNTFLRILNPSHS